MRIAAGDAADERSEREEERLDLSAGGSGTTSHETCRLASASPLATRLPAGVSSCAQRSNRSESTPPVPPVLGWADEQGDGLRGRCGEGVDGGEQAARAVNACIATHAGNSETSDGDFRNCLRQPRQRDDVTFITDNHTDAIKCARVLNNKTFHNV